MFVAEFFQGSNRALRIALMVSDSTLNDFASIAFWRDSTIFQSKLKFWDRRGVE